MKMKEGRGKIKENELIILGVEDGSRENIFSLFRNVEEKILR
jgi:hypothetical protein